MEIDPNLHVVSAPFLSSVHFQYAHTAMPRGAATDKCEVTVQSEQLQYDIFQVFLAERDNSATHYMDKMQEVMTLQPEFLDFSKKKVSTLLYY